jgi:hypothetical protein
MHTLNGVTTWVTCAELMVSDFEANYYVMDIASGATVMFVASNFTGNVITKRKRSKWDPEAIIFVGQLYDITLHPQQWQDGIVSLEQCKFADNSAANLIFTNNNSPKEKYFSARVFSDDRDLQVLNSHFFYSLTMSYDDVKYNLQPAEPLSDVPPDRQLNPQPLVPSTPLKSSFPVKLIMGVVGGVLAMVLLVAAALIMVFCCVRRRQISTGTEE